MPKTEAGVRSIPVPAQVTDMLAAHLAEFSANDDGLVFTAVSGGPISRSSWSDDQRNACATVGVVGRTRTHDLRRVAASSLIASGLSVSAVQAAIGQATPSETRDTYTHFWLSDATKTGFMYCPVSEVTAPAPPSRIRTSGTRIAANVQDGIFDLRMLVAWRRRW